MIRYWMNERAHRSPEIFKTYEQARTLGFPQINIDLISGMVGETEGNWQACVEKVLELAPDIITIYQMEVPFNTIIHQEMEHEGRTVAPVADWITKRRWVQEAFERLESAGYTISSAYSAVKKGINAEFLYRDYLWEGADLLGLGVASFSHINGTHFQNEKDFVPYLEAVEEGRFPIRRALALSEEEKLIREMILQLKRGSVRRQYFTNKFPIDILDRFSVPLRNRERENYPKSGGFRTVDSAEVCWKWTVCYPIFIYLSIVTPGTPEPGASDGSCNEPHPQAGSAAAFLFPEGCSSAGSGSPAGHPAARAGTLAAVSPA